MRDGPIILISAQAGVSNHRRHAGKHTVLNDKNEEYDFTPHFAVPHY